MMVLEDKTDMSIAKASQTSQKSSISINARQAMHINLTFISQFVLSPATVAERVRFGAACFVGVMCLRCDFQDGS